MVFGINHIKIENYPKILTKLHGQLESEKAVFQKAQIAMDVDVEAVQDVPTNIQPKDLDISASISVVFEIIQ